MPTQTPGNRKTFIICWFSIGLHIMLACILFTPMTEQLYKPLLSGDQPAQSEVIVILSAGCYKSGALDFRSMIRIQTGFELYRRNLADTIICSGGVMQEGTENSVAEIMKNNLMLLNVPADKILVQDNTRNTYNDITAVLAKYNGTFDFNRAMFVTSAYHTYRVKRILRKKGLTGAKVIAAEAWELTPHIWGERLDLFREIIREYGANLYFLIRGWA